MRRFQMSLDTLLSTVGTVTIVVAAGIAIWQIREAARAKSLDGFTALAENLRKTRMPGRPFIRNWLTFTN
jgi:hypothetical protein